MTISNRLTLLFAGIVAVIILASTATIYYLSSEFRRQDFEQRLLNKGKNIAKLLIEVEEVDIDLLSKIERDNPLSLPNEEIFIFNYNDSLLFKGGKDILPMPSKELIDNVRLKGYTSYKQGLNDVVAFLFTDKYDRFVVWITATDIYGYRKLKYLTNVLLVVILVSIAVVLIAGRLFAARALTPIQRINEQVEKIGAQSLNMRLAVGNEEDEIAGLKRHFNMMLERIDTAFQMQKNFIANASHELRTPIAIIKGQLEVLLQKERTPDEYADTVQSVLNELTGLNETSNKLLLLAQASAEDSKSAFTQIHPDEIILQARAEVLKRFIGSTINVSFNHLDEILGNYVIAGNEILLKTAVINLLENACKYSIDNTANVHLSFKDDAYIIEVIDNGIGISKEDMEQIFQPFYRGHNTTGLSGHGVGLSLTKQIINRHEGTITIDSVLNKGSVFRIILPAIKLF